MNPIGLKGQIHGGVAQGIGQILCEQVVWDRESGQLLTASFLDYAMPHAADDPEHGGQEQSGAHASTIRWAPRARARRARSAPCRW